MPDRTQRRRPTPLLAIWATIASFLVLLALLAWRLDAGRDPRGSGRQRTVAARQVLVRRVYERRVIVQLPSGAASRPASSSQRLAGAQAPSFTPVTRPS
jgi:hypothetical protein